MPSCGLPARGSARNRPAAARFAKSVKRAVHLLSEFPHLGVVALDIEPQGRYRHVIHGRYRIIYRVDAEVVYILRFWDCRRDPNDLTLIE